MDTKREELPDGFRVFVDAERPRMNSITKVMYLTFKEKPIHELWEDSIFLK